MLIYRTAGGGGWKDRLDRPVEAVERDVAFGLVSREKARRRRTAWSIGDAAATEAERARQRAERGDALAFDFGPPLEEALAQLRGRDRAAGAVAGQAAALVAAGGPRVARSPACARWLRRFGGAAGFGERPAVVVVDLNVGFTDPASPLACDLDDVLVATRALLDAARARGRAVFFTTIVYDEVGEAAAAVFLRKVPALKRAAAGDAVGRDRPAARPARRRSRCSSKAHASAFFGVPFAALLAGRDTLIVCGASTSGCVRATVVDAMQHGLAPIVPRECVGDRSAPRAHEQALDDIGPRRDVLPASVARGASGEVARALDAGRVARGPSAPPATRATLDQRVEVDAGLDALVLEQVDQVLGGDVAGRARRERAAAEAADATRRRSSRRARGRRRRSRSRCCACCAGAGRRACRPSSARGHELAHLRGHADADRVGEDHLVGARRRHPVRRARSPGPGRRGPRTGSRTRR